MKVLWLSITNGANVRPNHPDNYNGGGWIASLQHALCGNNDIELALSFLSDDLSGKDIQNGVTYYPIHAPKKSAFKKILHYYGGYKHDDNSQHLTSILEVISDFQPDVIHLFGIENPLATILGRINIPVVVHLQGLLAPYDNAFFPVGFNKSSFLLPLTVNEWLIRNGYRYAKNNIQIRGRQELQRFKNIAFCMGRTEWDHHVSQLLAPQSKYFHVDEVLRMPFYDNAGKWESRNGSVVITSTISETIYKGLDLILKTARLLKHECHLNFKWQVIGINQQSRIIRFFERNLGINSESVNVEYMGVMNANELVSTLLDTSMYVHPSYIDNSPNSLCEAQMLGLPVIATYVGGIPSLIKHGETGFLVPSNAPFELAYHIKQIADSPALAQQISKAGTGSAMARHDKEKITSDLLDVYKRIAEESIA